MLHYLPLYLIDLPQHYKNHHPGPARGPAPPGPPPDLEPDAYRRMLCVEAAVARAPVVLAPQATWRGTQTLRVA